MICLLVVPIPLSTAPAASQCEIIDDGHFISTSKSISANAAPPNTKTYPSNTRPGSPSTRHAQHQTFSWCTAVQTRAMASESQYEHDAIAHDPQSATLRFGCHGRFSVSVPENAVLSLVRCESHRTKQYHSEHIIFQPFRGRQFQNDHGNQSER